MSETLLICSHISFSITKESIVDVQATVVKTSAPVESCTVSAVELVGARVWVVSAARAQLPLQVEDAARPETSDVSGPKFTMHCSVMRAGKLIDKKLL